MKIEFEDMDVEDIPRRNIKEKDKWEVTNLWQYDPKQCINKYCDKVLKWTMGKKYVEYVYLRLRHHFIEEKIPI